MIKVTQNISKSCYSTKYVSQFSVLFLRRKASNDQYIWSKQSKPSRIITLFMIRFGGLFTFRRLNRIVYTMQLETKSKQMIFSSAR